MKLPIILLLLALAAAIIAQPALAQRPNPNPEPEIISLWEGKAPGALGDSEADRPTLTFFRAARQPIGTSVIIAPGGGYAALAMDHEGRYVAAWFNAMGVSAFVLKYRLGPRYHHP